MSELCLGLDNGPYTVRSPWILHPQRFGLTSLEDSIRCRDGYLVRLTLAWPGLAYLTLFLSTYPSPASAERIFVHTASPVIAEIAQCVKTRSPAEARNFSVPWSISIHHGCPPDVSAICITFIHESRQPPPPPLVAGCGEHLPAWGLRDDRIPGTDQAVRGGRHGQKLHSGFPPRKMDACGSADARSSTDACLS